jgi:hypothetical protein
LGWDGAGKLVVRKDNGNGRGCEMGTENLKYKVAYILFWISKVELGDTGLLNGNFDSKSCCSFAFTVT